MAKIDVSFAALHSALFFGGKSFGLKLDAGLHGGLTMVYDPETRELIASWQGKIAHIPVTNIASYTPATHKEDNRVVTPISHSMSTAAVKTAQVETPFGHVHAGPGKGKTK